MKINQHCFFGQVLKVPAHTVRDKVIDPKRAKSRPICKKIFVGGIDSSFPEEDIKTYFAQYGTVEGIELPFDRTRGKRREFCFIIFDTEESADLACRDPKQNIGSRECDVKKAQPQPVAQQQKKLSREGGPPDDGSRGRSNGNGATGPRRTDGIPRPYSQSGTGGYGSGGTSDAYGQPSYGNGYGSAGGGAYGAYPGYNAAAYSAYGQQYGQGGYGDYYNQFYQQQQQQQAGGYGQDYWSQYGYSQGYGAEGEYPAAGYAGGQQGAHESYRDPSGGGGSSQSSHSSHHSSGKISSKTPSTRAPNSSYHPYGGRGSQSSH